jgi:hypothetical protein
VTEHGPANSKDNSAPLRSYEEQRKSGNPVDLAPETRRMHWTWNGPLETAITIMRNTYFDPNEVSEPYYLGLSGNGDVENGKANWHPFSQLPLTEPKVSSLRLSVDPLDYCDYNWTERHDQHLFLDENVHPTSQ